MSNSELPSARYQPLKIESFVVFLLTPQFFLYFYRRYLKNGNSKAYEPYHTKNEPFFDISMTITPGVNMITRKVTPFSASTLRALFVDIFHFCILRPSKFTSMRSPFALCSGLWNTHLHAKYDTFKPFNMDILFLHKICELLIYTCSIPNLIPIWSQSDGLHWILK